jgi:hypothetical protein
MLLVVAGCERLGSRQWALRDEDAHAHAELVERPCAMRVLLLDLDVRFMPLSFEGAEALVVP